METRNTGYPGACIHRMIGMVMTGSRQVPPTYQRVVHVGPVEKRHVGRNTETRSTLWHKEQTGEGASCKNMGLEGDGGYREKRKRAFLQSALQIPKEQASVVLNSRRRHFEHPRLVTCPAEGLILARRLRVSTTARMLPCFHVFSKKLFDNSALLAAGRAAGF